MDIILHGIILYYCIMLLIITLPESRRPCFASKYIIPSSNRILINYYYLHVGSCVRRGVRYRHEFHKYTYHNRPGWYVGEALGEGGLWSKRGCECVCGCVFCIYFIIWITINSGRFIVITAVLYHARAKIVVIHSRTHQQLPKRN